MPRASTVITLVILGSALSLIGWSCYHAMQDDKPGGQGGHGHRSGFFGPHLWFFGGGGGSSGGARPSSGGVSRGGFGGSGGGASVGS